MKLTKNLVISMLLTLLGFAVLTPQTASGQKADVAAKLPANWVVLRPAGNVFSVSMPSKPTIETQKMGAEAGNMSAAYYTSEASDAFAMIAHLTDLPVGADRFDKKSSDEFFEGFRVGLVNGFKESLTGAAADMEVKFDKAKPVMYKGLNGIDQNVSIGNFKARTRMLLAKGHIFMFFVMPLPNADPSLSDTVINSFTFLGK